MRVELGEDRKARILKLKQWRGFQATLAREGAPIGDLRYAGHQLNSTGGGSLQDALQGVALHEDRAT